MKSLTIEEKDKIRNAVKKAELKSSGEFVTVMARKSDSYFYIPIIWSAMIALIVPVVLVFVFSLRNVIRILDIQFGILFILYVIFHIESITMMLTPKHIRKNRAKRLAMEQFLVQNVSFTKNRSGILFFVSEAEKYVQIIADKGINDRVNPDEWQKIVDEFIENVHNKKVCDGFIKAIEKCSDLLALHFPGQKNDVNELSDNLVEL